MTLQQKFKYYLSLAGQRLGYLVTRIQYPLRVKDAYGWQEAQSFLVRGKSSQHHTVTEQTPAEIQEIGSLIDDPNDVNYGKWKVTVQSSKGPSFYVILNEPLRGINSNGTLYCDYIDINNRICVRNIKSINMLDCTFTYNTTTFNPTIQSVRLSNISDYRANTTILCNKIPCYVSSIPSSGDVFGVYGGNNIVVSMSNSHLGSTPTSMSTALNAITNKLQQLGDVYICYVKVAGTTENVIVEGINNGQNVTIPNGTTLFEIDMQEQGLFLGTESVSNQQVICFDDGSPIILEDSLEVEPTNMECSYYAKVAQEDLED